MPRRLGERLRLLGHDPLHTLDLPQQNRTPDATINRISVEEQRVVVTKDVDFVDSVILRGAPYKLLLISTGNIRNAELEALFFGNLDAILMGLDRHTYLELERTVLRIHF